jgi:magnesium transporter
VITCRLYRGGVLTEEAFDPERVSDLIVEPGARVWLDLADPSEDELSLIEKEFGLHPLAIEDARHRNQRPKMEIYEGYFFLVVHALSKSDQRELQDSEIHVFAGHRFLITLRYSPLFDLAPVIRRWDRQSDLTSEGAGFLLYALLDEVVDQSFSLVDRYEETSEDIEDRVFSDEPDPALQEDIFRTKRQIVEFRRLIAPLREALGMIQQEPKLVTPALAPYYRDVADHVIRILEFTDNLRDTLTSALEAQLSQVSNRLNQIMKQLTSWAAIILVPTLIAGIYGMNFIHMPELRWRYGYAYALGLMLLTGLLLYRVFKRRDWL